MKICLISASIEEDSRAIGHNPNSHYPIGLASLHSYIESKGHEVDTLFLNDEDYDSCLKICIEHIEKMDPEYVGLQIITHNRVCSYQIIEYLAENMPLRKVVLGGIHASFMYEQLLKKYPNVVVVVGEGEVTLSELLEQKPLQDILGIAYCCDGEIIKNGERPLIENLDILPFPKHEIFMTPDRDTVSIQTTRGCPFNCTFCCLDIVSRRKIRYRSISSVIEEIEYLIMTYKIKRVWIHDDSFFLDNKRVVEFCNEIEKRNIKINFTCSGRLKPLSHEMLSAMVRVGFDHILFGLESGAEQILETCKKGITKDDAISAYKLLSKHKIRVTAFLIVGLPGESWETVKETAKFVQKLQKINYMYYDDIGILAVYPGTQVYSLAVKKGVIGDDFWLTDKSVPLYTAEIDAETLCQMKKYIQDRIALKKMKTLTGIISQGHLLPWAIRWLVTTYGIKNVVKYLKK